MGVLATAEEAAGGVGGAAGMKKEGMHATEAMMETMRTVVGREPSSGFTRDATFCGVSYFCCFPRFLWRTKEERKTYGSTERVRHACQCRGSHSPRLGKPHVAISCRRGQYKRLRQTCQNLACHDDPEDAAVCHRARIPDPVTR